MFLAWDKSPVLLSFSGGGKEESKGNAVYRRCSELSKVKDCEVQRMLMPLITLGQDRQSLGYVGYPVKRPVVFLAAV